MLFFVSVFFWLLSHMSNVSIYAPELVIDENAVMLSERIGYYGIELIYSKANHDWYSFLFVGISTKSNEFTRDMFVAENVAGIIFTSNPNNMPDTDMLDRLIPFWYSTNERGKSRGLIFFRGSVRKLSLD